MAGAAVGWMFWALWLVIPLWTFFDAEERGRSSILWAILTLVFGPLGLAVYAITLGREDTRGLLPGSRGRQYLFAAAFFFLLVVYVTLVGLLIVALDAAWGTDPLSGDDARLATAVLLAILVFALPLWAFHWVRAQSLVDEAKEESMRRVLYLLERGYGGAVVLIGSLVTIGFGIFLVFALFAAVMDVYEGGRGPFIPVIAFLPLTLLVLAYHWLAIFRSPKYRELAATVAETGEPAAAPVEPSPQPTAPPSAAPPRRFCGQCGAENPLGSRFCSACGAQLQPSTP